MNPDTGTLMSEADALALRQAFGLAPRNSDSVFPAHWPKFRVGLQVIIGGVDCKITDIDGRQITAMPVIDVWPKLSQFESVTIGTADLRVWKISRKGIVFRHQKQCSE